MDTENFPVCTRQDYIPKTNGCQKLPSAKRKEKKCLKHPRELQETPPAFATCHAFPLFLLRLTDQLCLLYLHP